MLREELESYLGLSTRPRSISQLVIPGGPQISFDNSRTDVFEPFSIQINGLPQASELAPLYIEALLNIGELKAGVVSFPDKWKVTGILKQELDRVEGLLKRELRNLPRRLSMLENRFIQTSRSSGRLNSDAHPSGQKDFVAEDRGGNKGHKAQGEQEWLTHLQQILVGMNLGVDHLDKFLGTLFLEPDEGMIGAEEATERVRESVPLLSAPSEAPIKAVDGSFGRDIVDADFAPVEAGR